MIVPRRQVLKSLLSIGLAPALLLPVSLYGQSQPPSFQGKRRSYTQTLPPYPAPQTNMHTAKGGVTNLHRYRGKVILLNFWATWCPACLHELPALDRLEKELGGRNFAVVTLNVDEDGPVRTASYFKRLGITNLPLLHDPAGRAAHAFGLHHGLPWSFIIDRRGNVQGYLMGAADWDSTDARRLLAHYLFQTG